MKKINRFMAATVIVLTGLPFLALGIHIALTADWNPKRKLRLDEAARIAFAEDYVNAHAQANGKLPTQEEFLVWGNKAPETWRLDGVGFSYEPSHDAPLSYAFSFWDGNTTITWRSTSSPSAEGEIDPKAYFFAGNKLSDMLIFFSIAAAFCAAAYFVIPKAAANAR